jgi:hypothetical protein
MTETMYARDLRVIWRSEQQVFELPDGEGGWTVYWHADLGTWHGRNQEGTWCAEVSHRATADETIHAILGDPVEATDWEAYTLGRLIELGWMSGGHTEAEDAALANLALRGLAVKVEQDRRMVWRPTPLGVAKAAMLA